MTFRGNARIFSIQTRSWTAILGRREYTLEDDSDTSDGFTTRPVSTGQKVVKPPNIYGTQDDAEGFTPVRTRQDRRQMRSQTLFTPTSDGKLPAVPQIRAKLTTTAQSAQAPQSPPAEIQLDYLNMEEALHLPVQLDTLTEILQERLLEMTNQIDRREQQLTEKLQQTEARLHKSERKTAAERQSHRQYIDKTIKQLEDWDENLLQREQTFERNSSMLKVQYERYTTKYIEWQQQAERIITAWHEVAQTTLKENSDKEIQQHTETIADFATNQEQQLVSCAWYSSKTPGKVSCRFDTDLPRSADQRSPERTYPCG
jgi:hypothetical protein